MLDELVRDRDVRQSRHGGGARLAQQPGTAVGITLAVSMRNFNATCRPSLVYLGNGDLDRAAHPEAFANVIVQDGLSESETRLAPDSLRRDRGSRRISLYGGPVHQIPTSFRARLQSGERVMAALLTLSSPGRRRAPSPRWGSTSD